MNRARAVYALRRAIRSPIAFYSLHREKNPSPLARQFYEHTGYLPSLPKFRDAIRENPDLLVDFGLDADSIVVDGGAYVGNWSERAARFSGAHIHSFEPNPAVLPRLHERASQYPNICVHEYGLGATNSTLTITLQGPGSSFFPDNYFASKRKVDTTTAQIRDVAEVFDELGVDHIDLLALNIEGSEYDVIPRLAETGWIPRIDALLVQFHEWLPAAHRRRRAIKRMLRETHTQLWDYPWVWEAWRRNEPRSATG